MTVEIVRAVGEHIILPIGIFAVFMYFLYIISKD